MFFKTISRLLIMAMFLFVIHIRGQAVASDNDLRIKVHDIHVIKAPRSNALSMPSDVAVGLKGNLYVMDGVKNRVVVFSSNGRVIFSFGGPGKSVGKFNYPLGIAIGNNGTVYIADTGNRRIQIFNAQGKYKKTIKVPSQGSNHVPDITDVAVNHEQNRLYMVDNENHRILNYDLSLNKFNRTWGSPGTARLRFRFPFMLTVFPGGYLIIVETINTRVQVLNSSGKFVSFIGSWGVIPGHFFRPKGVAVYEKKIFVTDSYLGWIQVFDIRGKYLGRLCDSKGSPLSLTTPMGVAIDPNLKRLYVAELKANRIRCITLE